MVGTCPGFLPFPTVFAVIYKREQPLGHRFMLLAFWQLLAGRMTRFQRILATGQVLRAHCIRWSDRRVDLTQGITGNSVQHYIMYANCGWEWRDIWGYMSMIRTTTSTCVPSNWLVYKKSTILFIKVLNHSHDHKLASIEVNLNKNNRYFKCF